MFTKTGKSTIFDGVNPHYKIHVVIPEINVIKKLFPFNKDGFDTQLIVDDYKLPSLIFICDDSLNDF